MTSLSWFTNIKRIWFLRSELDRLLTFSLAFSIMLVACRIIYTRETTFMYMPWNLLLGYVPFMFLNIMAPRLEHSKSKFTFLLVFGVWLLFIPNAFYMITDLFHLYHRENIPIWFDLILLMSFAWNGLILGFLSIRQMEKVLATKLPWLAEVVFVPAMMFLNSFGIYLGRFLRFNSWDIITDPVKLLAEMLLLVFNPIQYKEPWAMIVSFTVLMTIIYQMLKKLSKQLQ